MKIARKNDFLYIIPGISYKTEESAIKAISTAQDNGINVYNNPELKKIIFKTTGFPTLYSGEAIIYSLIDDSGKIEEIAFSGVISKILKVDLANGTSRGEQLLQRGIKDQWLLIVKRIGSPDIYDIIDPYGVSTKLVLVFNGINEEMHEMKDSPLLFEDIIELLTGGCLKGDKIVKSIIQKTSKYNKEIDKALEELTDPESDKTIH